MKKILALIALVALAVNCFAAGTLSVNTPQSGTVYFSTNGTAATNVTVTFTPAFTYTPAVSFFLSSGPTNATPLVTAVTATNLTITINASTNCSVLWVANPASPRIQFGTVSSGPNAGATTYTNTFSAPYSSAPSVVISGSALAGATNAIPVVSSVTATAFIVSYGANTNQTIYWQAVGLAYTPGASPNPVTY